MLTMMSVDGYHEYTGGIQWVHQGHTMICVEEFNEALYLAWRFDESSHLVGMEQLILVQVHSRYLYLPSIQSRLLATVPI